MALSLGEPGEYETTLWTLLAFIARYGHQGMVESQQLSVRDLTLFAKQIGKIVDEENASAETE